MLIKCPNCSKSNNLNLDAKINCGHCKEPLTGHTYGKIKKSVGAIVVAFGVGVVGTKQLIDYKGYTDRYSIKNEYAILDMCLNSSQRPLASYQYASKRDDCICALEEVQKSFNVVDYNKDTDKYLAAFESAAKQCKLTRTSLTY